MSAHLIRNFAEGVLATTMSAGASSFTVTPGSTLPRETGSFIAVVWDSTSYADPGLDPDVEIVEASWTSGNSYSVTRAREGTYAVQHNAGCTVSLYLTAALFQTASTWVNVKEFGATGDGTTDDTDAINAAVASLSGGGVAFFPPGTYLVGKEGSTGGTKAGKDMFCIQLLDNVTLEGSGSASTIKLAPQQGVGGSPYPCGFIVWAGNFSRPAEMGPSYSNNGKRHIAIRNLKLDCDMNNQPGGGTHNYCNINISECSDIRVQDCELVGGVAETCYVLGKHASETQTAFLFTNNYVHDTGVWGVDALGVHMDRINGGVCSNNNFQTIGLRAIGVGRCSDVVVSGNRIGSTYDGGIRVPGSTNILITGNEIYDANTYGIEITAESTTDSDDIVVVGNKITCNGTNGRTGIYIYNASNVVVQGNKIKTTKWDGISASDIIAGIAVKVASNGAAENVLIDGNMIDHIDPGYTSGLTIPPAGILILGQDGTYKVTWLTITNNNVNNCYNGIYGQYINKFINGANMFRDSTNANSTLTTDVTGVASCGTDNNNIQ